MDLELDGKVAVITGAGAGIGLATTKALAGEGAHVIAGSREIESLVDLENVTLVAIDLGPEAPAELVGRAIEDPGRIDVLVNNVGAVKLRMDGFLALSDEDFGGGRCRSTSSSPCGRPARLLGPMVEAGGGAIVNIASVNAFYHPDGNVIDYGAAKAAVLNLNKALAQEFGPQGVRVNAISPGPVETALWLGDHGVAQTVGAAMGVDADTARERIVAGMGGIPSGRFTRPEEVATLVTLLASERTANVTGANLVIDGGLIKTT